MIFALGQISDPDESIIGRKAAVLNRLLKEGWSVPAGVVLSIELYKQFLRETRLLEWLILTLEKRPIRSMSREEVWEMAALIRHKFIKTPFPEGLQTLVLSELPLFDQSSVIVRDSPPLSVSSYKSSDGRYDSIEDVRGRASILQAVKEVWSSLWSERALLSIEERHQKPEKSAMAVIIQIYIKRQESGYLVTESSGSQEKRVLEDSIPERLQRYPNSRETVTQKKHSQSIKEDGISMEILFQKKIELGKIFHSPQKVEWTFDGNDVFFINLHPVTEENSSKNNLISEKSNKDWNTILRKDFNELEALKVEFESEFMIQLDELADELSKFNIQKMGDNELESETYRRNMLVKKWEHTYTKHCIPFAEGFKIFAELYNNLLQPEYPFEFIDLLLDQQLKDKERNDMLLQLSQILSTKGENSLSYRTNLKSFLGDYGQSSFFDSILFDNQENMISLLTKLNKVQGSKNQLNPLRRILEQDFHEAFTALGRNDASKLLNTARFCYKLKKEANIHLGKIRGEYIRALNEVEKRQGGKLFLKKDNNHTENFDGFKIIHRQATGTGSNPGYASGKARIISCKTELFKLRKGEIIVCDKIDPNISFVIPLAAGIIESRGGMLRHSAIMAREYNIPCITGIGDATSIIDKGDRVTVDAYNGIVVIDKKAGL